MEKIFVHLPAYREPELIPTIKDALKQAKHKERIVFGICLQYNPDDKFDDLCEFENNENFKIDKIYYTQAKGLPYARYRINEMITDEDYILQLDSHHRFAKNWDTTLISMHNKLEKKGKKPILTGYLPYYNPFDDTDRTMEPWLQEAAAFYPHGTIFIRPVGIPNWKNLKEPIPSRFISGHFAFARTEWAKEIKHDPDIYFSGEEINLTVRSFTHGYDLFHPHKLVIWHATMREERNGILVWDDQSKRGEDWWTQQNKARAKIRQLFGVEDNGYDLTGFDLGKQRTLRDYEKYAGLNFQKKAMQKYTAERKLPPNPIIEDETEWEKSFIHSFYFLVNITKSDFPENDYERILVAFDDENRIGIKSYFIDDERLHNLMNKGTAIHYEEMFLTEKMPSSVVYWAYSKGRGWSERVEITL